MSPYSTSSPEPGTPVTPHAAPTLEQIIQLTRQELNTLPGDDSIVECGRAALSLLRTNPDLCTKLAYQKLHDVPYRVIKPCWRRLYTDATLWKVIAVSVRQANQTPTDADWIDEVVRLLDMTLILTGAPSREEIVELWFAALEGILSVQGPIYTAPGSLERPAKKLKLSNVSSIPRAFPTAVLEYSPTLRQPVSRVGNLSLASFQKKISCAATQAPLIIEDAIQHWPAFTEAPWSDPNYLLRRTLGGRRLVPIETGRSYTDAGWGQKISTFKDFLSTYMFDKKTSTESQESGTQIGYLAQHDLFAQIPSLRADISIPDFCYCDPAPNPSSNVKETPKLEDPLLNAWFGPRGTISPLHTDPYHNILTQVVGFKYVRLYAPDQTKWLYPRSVNENGVDMSNTSLVDLDEAMRVYPEIGIEKDDTLFREKVGAGERTDLEERQDKFEESYPGFSQARYTECVLGPGECLYLPPGWWHYVKSLSLSLSVSFWFN